MKNFYVFFFLLLGLNVFSQDDSDIVEVIDNLRYRWDASAINLKTYQGIQEFCLNSQYQMETNDLLDAIHHWDTTLYFVVQEKFDESEDLEAAATLDDIMKLETEYSTVNFKKFITDECGMLKVINDSFEEETVKKYEKDIKKFEKELVKYINSITYRIDIIDEHIHHLDFE